MYRLIRWLLPVLALLLALLYISPFLLSTAWGSRLLLSSLSENIPGRLEANSLKLRWFSAQSVKGIRLYGKGGQLILDVEEIRTELNLWNLLWSNLYFGHTHVIKPTLNLILEDKGSNLEQAIYKKTREKERGRKKKHKPRKHFISGEFYTVDGVFLTQSADLGKGALKEINGEVSLSLPTKGSFSVNANTESQHGQGKLEGKGNLALVKPPKKVIPKRTNAASLEGKLALTASQLPGPFAEALLRFATGMPALVSPFGNAIELTCKGALDKGSGEVLLGASSNSFACSLHLGLHKQTLTLLKPASFSLKGQTEKIRLDAPKNFWNAILAPYAVQMISGGQLEVKCTQYVAIWPKLFAPSSLALSAKAGPFTLSQEALSPLQVDQAELKISSPLDLKGMVTGQAFSLEGSWQKQEDKRTFFAKGVTLPMPWLDLLLPFSLTPYLGETLSIKGALIGDALTLNAESPLLHLPETRFSLADQIKLIHPTNFNYQLSSTLFPLLALPTPVSGKLQQLSLSTNLFDRDPFNPEAILVEGQLEADEVTLSDKKTKLINFFFSLGGSNLANGSFVLASLILNEGLAHLGSGALPVNTSGLFSFSKELYLTLPRFQLSIEGSHLDGLFVGSYAYPDTVGLLFPGKCSLNLSPNVMPALASPTKLSLNLDPSPVIFSTTEPERAHLVGKLTLPSLNLVDGEELSELEGSLLLNGIKDHGEFTLFANTHSSEGKKGMLEGRFSTRHLFSQTKAIKGVANLACTSFPLGIVSLFFPSIPLKELIGPSLTLNANTQFDKLSPFLGQGDLKADSSLLSADIGLKLGKSLSLLSKNRPAYLTWTATPTGFKALYTLLKKTSPLTLNEPTTFTTRLSVLNLPKAPFDPAKSSFTLDAAVTTLNLTKETKSALLNNLALSIDAKNLEKGAHAIAKGDLVTETKGSFQLEGQAQNLFSSEGAFEPKPARYKLQGRLDSLQTPILFDLAPFSEETTSLLNALFGSKVTGNIQAKIDNLSGPCSAQLESENSNFALDSRLKEGVLLLNKPFKGSLQVTPLLGKQFLKLVNPLLFTAFRSEKPALLELDNQQFSLPLIPFEPAKISLQKGQCDVGKIWLTNQAPLSFLLGLFKGQAFPSEMMAWSTPLYFHIRDGQMVYERTDILFEKALHCAFWGLTGLPSLDARMNLAILPGSLLSLLGLPAAPTSSLIIPFKGKLTHLKADWKRAALGMASLAIKEQGKVGKIVGGAFDIATGQVKQEVPPPTTSPFPWE